MKYKFQFLRKQMHPNLIALIGKYAKKHIFVMQENGNLWVLEGTKWIQIIFRNSMFTQRIFCTDTICSFDLDLLKDFYGKCLFVKDKRIAYVNNQLYTLDTERIYKDNYPLAKMKHSRKNYLIAVVDKYIFVIGGSVEGYMIKNAEYYDPDINEWKITNVMHDNHHSIDTAVVVFKGLIFLFGPFHIEYYSFEKNKWICQGITGMCLLNLNNYAVVEYEDHIKIIGGKYNDGTDKTNIIEYYPFRETKWGSTDANTTPPFGRCTAALF